MTPIFMRILIDENDHRHGIWQSSQLTGAMLADISSPQSHVGRVAHLASISGFGYERRATESITSTSIAPLPPGLGDFQRLLAMIRLWKIQ